MDAAPRGGGTGVRRERRRTVGWGPRKYIGAMFRALVTGVMARTAAAVPARCAVCGAWPARPVCDVCVQRFAQPVPRCRRCALPVAPGIETCGACLQAPPPIDACHVAVSYGFPWAGCITRFKFQGETGWAPWLALLLRSTPWVEPALEAADRVLPMPLSPQRLQERGYNQAALLARHLAPDRFDDRLLLRIRHTPAQSGLDRAARLASVRGAFAVDPLRAAAVAGQRVVLIDDVMTSGASLHAAAAALRQAGAVHIVALAVARTD